MKKSKTDMEQLAEEAERLSKPMYDFEVLLDEDKKLDKKKRVLWKQIYRNAVDDRSTANTLFTTAYAATGTTANDHILMGATLIKYLEKMSKSNQQLLELSSLISKDEEQDSKIDPDDIFKQIEDKNG